MYIYFASEANFAIVLCKHADQGYQMLLWNTKTDEFTKGQWLRKGTIRAQKSYVSHGGKYFKYKLIQRDKHVYPRILQVVSKVPYFTARSIHNLDYGEMIIKGSPPKDQKWFPLSLMNEQMGELRNSEGTFRIFTDQGQILKNGQVILDLRNEKFTEVKPK
jgi:hypothetical protein